MSRTALYRHFDASGRLLYVGITDCLSERDKQHRATASWHGEVVRTETQWCLSREHAADLERVAVKHEKPLHNVHYLEARNNMPRAFETQEPTPSERLAAEMREAAVILGITPSTLGRMAGQGGHFFDRLVSGKRVWPQTEAKVRAFIAAHSASVQ